MNRFPMTGVECWKNEKNKFFVFQAHYSANEAKRDPSYKEMMKSAMPIRQYMQEFELVWDSFAGTPVYPDFNRSFHGSKKELNPVIGLPLLRGWDFGLTPACVIGQYVDGQLRILREFVEQNKGAEQFVPEVLKQCNLLYPSWSDQKKDFRDAIDPSGSARKDTDMSTCALVMAKNGLTTYPGPVAFEARKNAVEDFLIRSHKGVPDFLIDLNNCPTIVRGFEGGYRYPEKATDVEPNKLRPIKDEHSHPHDALQYICAKVKHWTKIKRAEIPKPGYWGDKQRTVGLG